MREKFEDMLLSTLAALGTIGSAIWGAAKSKRENKSAMRDLTETYLADDRVYNSQLQKNLTELPDYQNIETRLREMQDESTRRERGVNAVMGGSDAAVIAQKNANALSSARVAGDQAARSVAYKQGVLNQKLANRDNYTQQMANLKMRQGQTIANAAGQVSRAMAGLSVADNNTLGDDLAMFGLDTSQYERIIGSDGLPHLYRKR